MTDEKNLFEFGFKHPIKQLEEKRYDIIVTTCYIVRDMEKKIDINRYIDLDGTAYEQAKARCDEENAKYKQFMEEWQQEKKNVDIMFPNSMNVKTEPKNPY